MVDDDDINSDEELLKQVNGIVQNPNENNNNLANESNNWSDSMSIRQSIDMKKQSQKYPMDKDNMQNFEYGMGN